MENIFEKLKKTKGMGFLVIGLITGIIFLTLGSGEESKKEQNAVSTEENDYKTVGEMTEELERRVCELIERMDGVSDVRVMITPENTGETVYAQNGSFSGGSMTEREYVITDVDGDGKPIVIKLIYPKIRGVAVVCRGGSNPINQEKIVALLEALFDLSSNHVYVGG